MNGRPVVRSSVLSHGLPDAQGHVVPVDVRDLGDRGLQVRPDDYRGSGFDRGHLCPAADRSATSQDMDATFLMTNMVPQSPDLNRKTWVKLAEYARDKEAEATPRFKVVA